MVVRGVAMWNGCEWSCISTHHTLPHIDDLYCQHCLPRLPLCLQGDPVAQKAEFFVDKDAHFLYAKPEDKAKVMCWVTG